MSNPIDAIMARVESIKRDTEAGVPGVGIFWFHHGELWADSVPHTHGEAYGDYINGRNDHASYWRNLQRISPEFKALEYDEVPRGRVLYSKPENRFVVYGSRQFLQNEAQKAEVLKEFRLPLERVVFRFDEHYAMPD